MQMVHPKPVVAWLLLLAFTCSSGAGSSGKPEVRDVSGTGGRQTPNTHSVDGSFACLKTFFTKGRCPAPLHAQSTCQATCQTYGTCNEEVGVCDCPKNRTGDDCSALADKKKLRGRCAKAYYPSSQECVTSELDCMNKCNRRGKCVSGWCHCMPGV